MRAPRGGSLQSSPAVGPRTRASMSRYQHRLRDRKSELYCLACTLQSRAKAEDVCPARFQLLTSGCIGARGAGPWLSAPPQLLDSTFYPSRSGALREGGDHSAARGARRGERDSRLLPRQDSQLCLIRLATARGTYVRGREWGAQSSPFHAHVVLHIY